MTAPRLCLLLPPLLLAAQHSAADQPRDDAQFDILSASRTLTRPRSGGPEDLYYLAHGLQKQKRDADAAAHYVWALDLDPKLFPARINLGNILDNHGQLEEAAHQYRAAHALQPRALLAAQNLGNTLNRLGLREEALQALRTAVHIDPGNWQASLNAGNTLCALARLSQAIELYAALVRTHPQISTYLFRLAYLRLISGDRRQAEIMAEECIRVEAHHGPCLWVHGIATSGLTDRGIGSSSFALLASLMASTDENELLDSVYVPLRDANLMKIGDWDSVGNKYSLAMSMRQLNTTEAHKGVVDFFPETYSMPEEYGQLAQLKQSEPNALWMAKPTGSKNGLGIKVLSDPTEAPKMKGILVQRYVYPPHLVSGLKFNFRLYVIVTDIEPLRLYVYDQAMLYFSGEKFEAKNTEALASHISNRGYTESPRFFPDAIEWEGHPDAEEVDRSTRTLSAFMQYLEEEGHDAEQLWSEVKEVIFKSFAAVLPAMRRNWKKLAPKASSRYFLPRVTGLDVHLDESLKPWLLEVNPNPAMMSRKRIRSRVVRSLWTMVTPGAMESVVWPAGVEGVPPSEAQSWEREAAHDARVYIETTARVSKDCGKEDGCECLHPAMVDKIMVAELEWLKRGRFERIFPISSSEELHLPLLSGKINTCSVYWHTRLRERGSGAEEEGEGNGGEEETEHGEL
jgi:hypothetical protein